jgi:hypothetical protein
MRLVLEGAIAPHVTRVRPAERHARKGGLAIEGLLCHRRLIRLNELEVVGNLAELG